MESVDGQAETVFIGVSRAGSRRMKLGDNVSRLARELGVDRTCLYIWKRKLEQRPYRKRTNNEEPSWRESLYAEIRSRMRAQGGLSIQRMCMLAGISGRPVSLSI